MLSPTSDRHNVLYPVTTSAPSVAPKHLACTGGEHLIPENLETAAQPTTGAGQGNDREQSARRAVVAPGLDPEHFARTERLVKVIVASPVNRGGGSGGVFDLLKAEAMAREFAQGLDSKYLEITDGFKSAEVLFSNENLVEPLEKARVTSLPQSLKGTRKVWNRVNYKSTGDVNSNGESKEFFMGEEHVEQKVCRHNSRDKGKYPPCMPGIYASPEADSYLPPQLAEL